jgi:hypothetical protein
MKIFFCAFSLLFFIFSLPVYAETHCVGMAKSKYCLGVAQPNKEAYLEFLIDKGIDIQSRRNTSSRYSYGKEVEGASGLSLTTTLTIKGGKVSQVQQTYEIDSKDHESKNKVYALLHKRLSRQYGKPTATSTLSKVNYAEWVSKSLDIQITDLEDGYIIVDFTIPSPR